MEYRRQTGFMGVMTPLVVVSDLRLGAIFGVLPFWLPADRLGHDPTGLTTALLRLRRWYAVSRPQKIGQSQIDVIHRSLPFCVF
jgi:hypothetical protein